MPLQVVNGAQLMCSFGAAPSPGGAAGQPAADQQSAGREHRAVRHVHEHRQSAGGRRHIGGVGRADAAAIHSGHHGTVGSRLGHRPAGETGRSCGQLFMMADQGSQRPLT